ncbi:MAG TPA: hypothetical protein VFO51_05285 [Sphingomicrobium sp.]|nr:hypothetical protein [Sphingomicrobium sp.]
MTRILLALSLAFVAASPAYATGGMTCSTAGPRPIDVQLVIGHTVVSNVVQARLTDGGRDIAVTVAQAWLEPNEIRLDLTDPNAERHELRLRARRRGEAYDGSLWRGGKRRWVRCRES